MLKGFKKSHIVVILIVLAIAFLLVYSQRASQFPASQTASDVTAWVRSKVGYFQNTGPNPNTKSGK